MSIQLFSIAAMTLSLFAWVSLGQVSPPVKSEPPGRVLSLIEKYKAPPYPQSSFLDRETYDYRISNRRPVPATLTDVFICDIWQRITLDLKLTLDPDDTSDEVVKQALGIYLERDWSNIAGYRPWTHWNFIRRLKESQRDLLAGEIAEYIRKKGVRDVKDK
jgi:hypothetical protein